MLTFYGTPVSRKWRRSTVTLGHATLRYNLPGILRDGILTAKSRGRLKAVWLHAADRAHWAALHTVRHHGGRVEDVVVLEVRVRRAWLKGHGGSAAGLWRSVRDVPPRFIRREIGFKQLSRSPVEMVAAAGR
jgi:hypothetical protein